MTAWGRGCKACIVAPNGVRPGASAAGPYTRRGTGMLPVMFMARMAMPRLELRLRRFALPALDGHGKAAPYTGPEDERGGGQSTSTFALHRSVGFEVGALF